MRGVDRRRRDFAAQQIEPLPPRAPRCRERRRRVLAARRGSRKACAYRRPPSARWRAPTPPRAPAPRARRRARRRRSRRSRSRRRHSGCHHAAVDRERRRQRDVVAHGERFARLLDVAHRPEVGARGEGGKVVGQGAIGVGHRGFRDGRGRAGGEGGRTLATAGGGAGRRLCPAGARGCRADPGQPGGSPGGCAIAVRSPPPRRPAPPMPGRSRGRCASRAARCRPAPRRSAMASTFQSSTAHSNRPQSRSAAMAASRRSSACAQPRRRNSGLT